MKKTFTVERGNRVVMTGSQIEVAANGTITTEPPEILRECLVGDALNYGDQRIICFEAGKSTFFGDECDV